jgi:CheY-like chemotaxis protein
MTTDTQRASYAEASVLANIVRRVVRRVRAWLAASWLARTGTALADGLATAADASALANGTRALARWTRQSFCYRWLTKEPDPEVIVIDLRETYAFSPIIAVLDRVVPVFERTCRGSSTYRAIARLRTASKRAWLTDSKAVQLLRAAFEPPESPEQNRRE